MKTILTAIAILMTLGNGTLKWHTNLEEAKNQAIEKNQNIIIVFSGSDWCKPCIELKSTVLNSKVFKNSISNDFVLLNIDMKRNKKGVSKAELKHIEEVFEVYNPNGIFPYVVKINNKGEVLKTIEGYKGETSENYIEQLK